MKTIHYIIYIVLAVLSFTACQEEDFGSGVKGGIRITLAEEVGVDVTTRSTPEELDIPIATDFKIEATNSAGDKKYSGTFKKDETIPLDAGTYEVIAYYGTNETLALDTPYYEGIAENIDVKEGYTTPVTLTCKVANSLLSIRINEDDKEKFEASFKNPSFQLTVGGKSVATSDITKSFYFPAGSTITKLAFSKDGSDYQDLEIKNWPKEIKAADHIIVTVGIEPAPSGITLTVEKVKVQTVTIEETIPMEWLPKPSVSATGFDTNNSLTFAETETKEAKLDLKLASALQDIKFKFNFEDEQFSLDKEKEYVWSNEEDKKVISEQLGINVSDKSVDLNGLLAKLQTNAGVSTTNAIEVDVKANDRWSSEDENANRIYTITCNKPVFRVDAYPGNIWTKEFTMNALREEQVESGDFTKLSGDMTYQYSADGQTGWTNLSDGMRQDQLQPGTTYYIRGLYRDAVPGEVTEVSTYPETPLEYGDMEEWNTITKNLCVGTNIFNWRDVYGNSPSNNIWACVNAKTFEGDPNVYSTFNLNPSTYSVEGRSGKAAALRTVGWDNNWGNTSSLIRHIAAGKLFIGKYSFVHEDGPETYDYGMSYSSRPTSVEFYYTYSPYNGDSFKAWVVLENRSNDGNVTRIGYGELTGSESITSFTRNTISIEYSDIYLDITHMYIVFSSSANCSDVEETENNNLQGMVSEGDYHNGSVLTIDDIQLIYDK